VSTVWLQAEVKKVKRWCIVDDYYNCHLASIILCTLILSETLALYKSFTYLLTYLQL